jgi:hypothetical protein
MVLSSLAHSAKNAQSTHLRAFVNPLDADLELSYALRGCTSLGSHLLGVVIATTPASTSPASWTSLFLIYEPPQGWGATMPSGCRPRTSEN